MIHNAKVAFLVWLIANTILSGHTFCSLNYLLNTFTSLACVWLEGRAWKLERRLDPNWGSVCNLIALKCEEVGRNRDTIHFFSKVGKLERKYCQLACFSCVLATDKLFFIFECLVLLILLIIIKNIKIII